MEPTLSDPGVQQQWGMRVGIPNAGQLNALETLNIRGERSVTCKGDFDRASVGRAAAGRRAGGVRGVPQAARRARARGGARRAVRPQPGSGEDADVLRRVLASRTGTTPRTCAATGGNDVNFAMDAPQADSPDIAELRAKGAIIYARRHRRQRRRRVVADGAGEAEDEHAVRQPAVRAVGRPALQSLRHRARAARHQRRLGRLGRRQPGDLLDLRAGLGLVQGAGLAQRRRQPADHQGHHDGRRHRQQEAGRSRRHSLPTVPRRRARCSTPIKGFETEDIFTAHSEGADSEGAVTPASSSPTRT